jgi:osmotically-inducible protein OsmY
MTDEYLAEHVRDAMAHDPRVADLGITVTVGPGTVRLSGEVATEERRDAVAIVAREVVTGHQVLNDVTVTACEEPNDVENVG